MYVSTRPTDQRSPFVQITRPTAIEPIVGQPLAVEPLVFRIHRWQGRTIPCTHPECVFCDEFLRQDERIFLPIHRWKTGRTELLDLPASHWQSLREYVNRWDSLNRILLKAERTRRRDNAPIALHARGLRSEDPFHSVLVDPIPLVLAITAQNTEKARFDIETAKKASAERSVLSDRLPV